MLLAVGGASCSGKSTLTNWLSELLNCAIIHQDRFYKEDSLIPIENGVANWDCPEAIDFDAFIECLKSVKDGNAPLTNMVGQNRPKLDKSQISARELDIYRLVKEINALQGMNRITLVDGFLLYADKSTMDVFDLKLFLYADPSVLRNRRSSREAYITLEGHWEDPPNYFEEVVFPNYLKYNSLVIDEDYPDVVKIDSTENDVETVLIIALEAILSRLK